MDFGITRIVDDIVNFLPRIPEVLLSLIIGIIIIYSALSIFSKTLKIVKVPRALILILRSLLSIVLWVILVADLLRQVGLGQVAITISGSLLILGLAIANGANTLVADILSGLFLAKDPDFDVGYKIKSGDTEGEVESIDIRKTRIRTKEGKLIVLPNSVIDKERWHVVERPEKKPAKLTEMKS